MKFCQPHWERLREAIKSRGLWPLVARNGQEAIERIKEELGEGEASAAGYDPLMDAHNMISAHALRGGLYMLTGDYCPVCEFCKHVEPPPAGHRYADNESYMIDGPADAVAERVKNDPELSALLTAISASRTGESKQP